VSSSRASSTRARATPTRTGSRTPANWRYRTPSASTRARRTRTATGCSTARSSRPAPRRTATTPNRDGRGGLSDGVTDYDEIYRYGTDPTRIDTDGDGEGDGDGDEIRAGSNPLVDERSLGTKVGLGVTGFLLDDPSNLSPKGILKGLGKGLGAIGRKLGIGAGKQADEVITETAENVAAARRRRQAATDATPNGARGTGPVAERNKLRTNLERVHGPLPDGYEAHHLVAVGHPRAAGARRILERYGVDRNSAVNGVALPGRRSGRVPGEPYHPSIHTNRYYDAIEARLAGAQSRREVTQVLGTIRRDLLAGTFP
jgi:hypothetical protein